MCYGVSGSARLLFRFGQAGGACPVRRLLRVGLALPHRSRGYRGYTDALHATPRLDTGALDLRMLGSGRWQLSALVAVAALGTSSSSAAAARPLTRGERAAIVESTEVAAPNGGRIRDWRCINGQLSTVDGRFASVILTNTPACVDRYGGASGEATLDYRGSARATHWRAIGSIGGSGVCEHDRLVPDAVLRDLGCAKIVAEARKAVQNREIGPRSASVSVLRSGAVEPARAHAVPTVHGCPRPISYDHGAFEGGIYNFGFMPCHKARTVAREEMEGHHVPGFRCVEVRPNRVEPEGAARCTAGRAFVVFASE